MSLCSRVLIGERGLEMRRQRARGILTSRYDGARLRK